MRASPPALLGKWLALAWMNTITAWALALTMSRDADWVAGIVLGISTWWLILFSIDLGAQHEGHMAWSRCLATAAKIKAGLQLLILPDVVAGAVAIYAVKGLTLDGPFTFTSAFATTFALGGVYALMIAALTLLCFLASRGRDKEGPGIERREALGEVFD